MKCYFYILLVPVFFISESIAVIDREEQPHLRAILTFKNEMERSIERLKEMERYPQKYDEILESFKNQFQTYIKELYDTRLPQNHQEMLQRYRNIMADAIALLENDIRSGGNYKKLIKQFINNVKKSMTELERVELYPGNIEALKQYLKGNLNYLNYPFDITDVNNQTEKCSWHYRKMKNNENIKCAHTAMLTDVFVRLPTYDWENTDKQIHPPVPKCNCWELSNEKKEENIFVLEVKFDHQEVVLTLIEKTKREYILELKSGWQNINEKLIL